MTYKLIRKVATWVILSGVASFIVHTVYTSVLMIHALHKDPKRNVDSSDMFWMTLSIVVKLIVFTTLTGLMLYMNQLLRTWDTVQPASDVANGAPTTAFELEQDGLLEEDETEL